MLVLSRRQDDKIVFPNLGITVEVLKIAGRCVRIGVQAPPNVRVLRHELAEKLDQTAPPPLLATQNTSHDHRLRNRLNKATIGLQLAQKQLEVGQLQNADETLAKVLSEFQTLDDDFGKRDEQPTSAAIRRALLVEDDANESELLAGFLRLSGFNVDTACDGYDALEYLSEHSQPDIVLLDMQMPRCDGPTTVSEIRRNPQYSGLKVFAVSGGIADDMGVTIGPSGVDRWFRKPLNPQTLVAELNRDTQLTVT
jgi:carbon storage regulator CsrA